MYVNTLCCGGVWSMSFAVLYLTVSRSNLTPLRRLSQRREHTTESGKDTAVSSILDRFVVHPAVRVRGTERIGMLDMNSNIQPSHYHVSRSQAYANLERMYQSSVRTTYRALRRTIARSFRVLPQTLVCPWPSRCASGTLHSPTIHTHRSSLPLSAAQLLSA